MAVPLKFLLFLSLVMIVASQQLETDYVHDPGENTREYILQQNKEMKKFQKKEMQKMFAAMSGELGSLKESISSLTTALFPPRNLTEVEEVNADAGTIEFTGGTNPHVGTKIWVLQSKGGTSYREMGFLLEENRLGEDARLFLWGSNRLQQKWNGSQDNWQEEKTNGGNVILVTLRISAGGMERPRFKLKFNTTGTASGWVYSSQVVLGEGRQEVSFPPNNSHNYTPHSSFVAVVAPPRGGSFGLTLKFLDLPGTPPGDCNGNEFSVWFLEESPAAFPFTRLPSSVVRRCGKVGDISEPLGNSTFAILRFDTDDGPVGRGFRVGIH